MDTINKIISLLAEKGLTQKELTDHLGIEKSVFSAWKSGKSQSYTKYITQIAEFLDTTPSYLLGWTDDPTDYEKTNENLEVPLDVLRHFDGDAEKIYNYGQAVKKDVENEQKEEWENKQIQLIARHLADIPKEDREQLIKNFQNTVDIYLAAKGLKKKDNK